LLLAPIAAAHAQIIIDTDSGFFADDGVAVTMLMRSARRNEVKGITVVSGNVWSREGAGYMSRNARLLGAPELPVLIGSEAPLIHTAAMAKAEQPLEFAGAFSQALPRANPIAGGIDFLIRTIDAAPGRITLLAIGPLTNLAIALRIRPDLAPKIRSLVMMGGAVHTAGNASKTAEFNFWFDPEAASIVLRSAIPSKILVPLDVCNKMKVTKEVFDSIASAHTPIADLYREDFGNRYPGFLKNPHATGLLWDELAAAVVIDKSLITKSETSYLDVETTFGSRYGAIKPLDRAITPDATPVTAVMDVKGPQVFSICRGALTGR